MTNESLGSLLRCDTQIGQIPTHVVTGAGAISTLGSTLNELDPDIVALVYDQAVPEAFVRECRDEITHDCIPVALPPVRDGLKTLSGVENLLDLVSPTMTRSSLFVSLGGGSVTNTAGLASGLLYRGISLIHVPTTLMGQADAAIGLKQTVNSPKAKNVYGIYHTPRCVVNDTTVLASLSSRLVSEGFAEIAKVALARGGELYDLLRQRFDSSLTLGLAPGDLARVIHLTVKAKLDGLSSDPREEGPLRLMELGHVTAHSIETASDYRVSHGRAVAVGVLIEALYSMRVGLLNSATYDELSRFLSTLRLVPEGGDLPARDLFAKALSYSNKRTAIGTEIVIPIRIGETRVIDKPDLRLLVECYDELLK